MTKLLITLAIIAASATPSLASMLNETQSQAKLCGKNDHDNKQTQEIKGSEEKKAQTTPIAL
jgi:hypothetical protein